VYPDPDPGVLPTCAPADAVAPPLGEATVALGVTPAPADCPTDALGEAPALDGDEPPGACAPLGEPSGVAGDALFEDVLAAHPQATPPTMSTTIPSAT
jgi:hypothetical protein